MSYRCLDTDRKIYIRKDCAAAFTEVNQIIFDFDGVLVCTSQSYPQTIRRVVDYYFLHILGLEGEEGRLVTLQDIHRWKDTGLYNNDWNLTYTITAYYLILLMRRLQRRGLLPEFRRRVTDIQFSQVARFLPALREIGEFITSCGLNAAQLVDMKERGNPMDICPPLTAVGFRNQSSPVDTAKSILPQPGDKQWDLIRRLIPYHQGEPDLLKRLFEEAYLGAELFQKFYGLPSIFKFKESYLEKEKIIPTQQTMDMLYSRFGRLGIYSEKPRHQGMYHLEKNHLTEYFHQEECVFQEDLYPSQPGEDCGALGKPNPALFIRMVENLAGKVAYVGDSMADALLVEKACMQGLSDTLFLAVLSSSQSTRRLLPQFMDHMAHGVMTDVNDIPLLYGELEGKV